MRVIAAWTALLCQAAFISSAVAAQSAVIYPSGSTIPENLLHFEVRFSQPLMGAPESTQVKLLDQDGQEIQDALLDLMPLSSDGRRVTILMHPGRVKSGVGANLALGRALQAGSTVTLLINVATLAHPVSKSWTIAASDVAPIDPARWTIAAPKLGTRDALIVHLDKAINSAADELIAVRDEEGERVSGRVSLDEEETIWRFTPSRRWRSGTYAIVTHPDLEDVAGNRSCAAFELPSGSKMPCAPAPALPFQIQDPNQHSRDPQR